MLQPPPGIRERILVLGGFGSGKTTSWLNIAKWSKETGSDAKFYVLDTDSSVRHMLSVPGSQYANLDNVILYEVYEFPDYMQAVATITPLLRSGIDWIVVDFVSSAWDAVQEYYVEQIYGADIASFFLEQAKSRDQKAPLDGWKDWSVINKLYKGWMNKLVHTHDAHLFMVAGAKSLGDSEDRSVRALFGSHGVRPTGQKHLGHVPHSVLLTRTAVPGEIHLSTIKDRERKVLDGAEKLNEFALDYLVNIAGWRLV